MRRFNDSAGTPWLATAREERTPRHHGRFYLVFRPADDGATEFAVSEVRWQNLATAERTLRTMSESELQRRLRWARTRVAPDLESAREMGAPANTP
jgi:hypothetical protein